MWHPGRGSKGKSCVRACTCTCVRARVRVCVCACSSVNNMVLVEMYKINTAFFACLRLATLLKCSCNRSFRIIGGNRERCHVIARNSSVYNYHRCDNIHNAKNRFCVGCTYVRMIYIVLLEGLAASTVSGTEN